ncbi:hypothetical protein PGT21_020173 [Puccinia graminis f. sp. tritici]|uniref:Uncharacterized protein n=1 Tax=Puccinia graminis f. sp. tritici TaxID=56615 RepID=A0A5B0PDU5_PUCGR|nr:hypothetical protein PGT21_020173 [Puccinia graminis f. sp. tritici]
MAQTIQAHLVLRAESEPHHSLNISIFLSQNLYSILKHGISIELMSRKLIVIDLAGKIANTVGPEDWAEYDALAPVVINDCISAQKVMGFAEKLHYLIRGLSDILIQLIKIIEPGVLLDEPTFLKPASAMMIDACFNSIQAGGVINQATQKQSIEVFNKFFS